MNAENKLKKITKLLNEILKQDKERVDDEFNSLYVICMEILDIIEDDN